MIFKKPSGLEVETNDEPETIEYCLSIGWVEVKPKKETKESKVFKDSE